LSFSKVKGQLLGTSTNSYMSKSHFTHDITNKHKQLSRLTAAQASEKEPAKGQGPRQIKTKEAAMDTSDTTEESFDMSTKKSSSVVRARTNRRRSKNGSIVIKDLSVEDQNRARKFDIDGDGKVSVQLGQLGSRN